MTRPVGSQPTVEMRLASGAAVAAQRISMGFGLLGVPQTAVRRVG